MAGHSRFTLSHDTGIPIYTAQRRQRSCGCVRDATGQFALSAHDHWYTSTSADIVLSVSSRLYQRYWEFGPSVTLIDEHRTSSSNSDWVDQHLKLSYSTSVSANNTVLIFVEVVLDTNAHSSHAKVDVISKQALSDGSECRLYR